MDNKVHSLAYAIQHNYRAGKHWQKAHLKGLLGKYLANAVLNKTMCAYIINNYYS